MSGFMPRHIEQPAPRQSKPAARKTSSRPSASAWRLTCTEPGTTIASTCGGDAVALDDRRGGAQVADPRVRARADEDAVEPDVLDRRPGPEVHVGQRALLALAGGLGDDVGDADDLRRVRPPADHRAQRAGVDDDLLVEGRAGVGAQVATRPGRPSTAALGHPREGRLVGRDHARRGRRPRSSCCRPSCGPPSRAPRSPGRRTRRRGPRRRRRPSGRSCRG